MNYKIILISFCFLFLQSCETSKINNSNKLNLNIEKKYKNVGFALIYDDNLNLKKIDNRSFDIFHNSLKRNSNVKITNLHNGKSVIARVKSNKQNFSKFYNSVLSKRIVEILELDLVEPYIEIVLISKNSTFIAKKTKTFDEEKKVAEKAPIEGIIINDLQKNKKKNKKDDKKKKFSYSIKLGDFYYKSSAQLLVDRINNETVLTNYKIIKLSATKFRVLLGPFNDIKTLKESFEQMNSLDFENLEILKNV